MTPRRRSTLLLFNIETTNSMSVNRQHYTYTKWTHETEEHTKTYTVFQILPTLKCSISDMMAAVA